MPANINLQDIAQKNPGVDLQALEEGRKLRKNLREIAGVRERPIVRPSGRKRVRIDDSVSNDPRVIRLQRPSD